MTITAKFASRCPICSGPIHPGQEVEWRKGSKAVHVACAGAAAGGTTAPVQSAPTPASTRTITVERVGRRSYLRGDTIAVRGMLRDGGAMTDFIDWLAGALLWEAMRVAAPRPTLPSAGPPPFAAVLHLIEHDIAAARVCQCPPMWPLAQAAKHHPVCPRSAP